MRKWFFLLCEMKSRKRILIAHIDPWMKVAIEKDIIPRFGKLIICNSKKAIKDNFLNFLWALSCVILSSDCRSIVF